MVLKVKWKRINDILHLKNYREINLFDTFIHKIQSAHVCWNLFLWWDGICWFKKLCIKGYLCYKAIFCMKINPWCVIHEFFYLKKECFVLEISKFLCFYKLHRSQNQSLLHNESYTYAYFFWILGTIKMKFGQILVCCMTNMFLVYCWRLETSSRPFYDFIKLTIWQDLAIFNSWHLPFLNVPYSPFQENETLESWYTWLLNN